MKNSNAKQSICLALLGNKDDLEENNKVVKKIDGEQMAKELNMPFYDVSALRGQNVELSFNEWIDSIKLFQIEERKNSVVNCSIIIIIVSFFFNK